ncbi:MAG: serine/threonine-protein kinase [Kofleriaceae bacterium]
MSTGEKGGLPSPPVDTGRPTVDTPRLVVRAAGTDSVQDTAQVESDTVEAAVGVAHASAVPLDRRREDHQELIGSTLSGRYTVTRKVGQGGMGAVYEATHTVIGRRFAVKVLLDKYAKRDALVARLEKEAKLASSIGHEHIIDITDFGVTEDGRTFVVMEFLEGESLAECLQRETRLPEGRILHMVQQAASALSAAHEKGVMHRDIKPENIFLLQRRERDFVKVVDFGISKSMNNSDENEAAEPRLTQTGMVLGTPLYMSPEQARGDDDLDPRVDVYALGVIMYEAATGRVPFQGNNYLSVISQVLGSDPVPPRQLVPELSEEFEALVMRAMAKDREDRYPTCAALLADLNTILDDPSHSTERARITGPRKKPPRKSGTKIAIWVASISVTVAALMGIVTFMMRSTESTRAPAVTPPPPPPDAPRAAPTPAIAPDAAPAVPRTVEYQVTSIPPGARIWEGGRDLGVAPTIYRAVRGKDERIRLIAELDGYNDTEFFINAALDAAEKPIEVTLERPKTGAPRRVLKRQTPSSGTPKKADSAGGGELGGNPYRDQ